MLIAFSARNLSAIFWRTSASLGLPPAVIFSTNKTCCPNGLSIGPTGFPISAANEASASAGSSTSLVTVPKRLSASSQLSMSLATATKTSPLLSRFIAKVAFAKSSNTICRMSRDSGVANSSTRCSNAVLISSSEILMPSATISAEMLAIFTLRNSGAL